MRHLLHRLLRSTIHLGILLLPCLAQGQNLFDTYPVPEHIKYIRYLVQDGLSSNIVSAIHQDDKGFLWVGTSNGLNRFDGQTFKSFYPDYPSFKNSLSDGWITSINQYKRKLYIGTQHGISIFNLNTNQFEDIAGVNKALARYHDDVAGIYFENNVFTVITDSTFEVLDTTFNRLYFKNASHRINSLHRYYFGLVKPVPVNKHIFIIHTADALAYFDIRKKQLYTQSDNPAGYHLYASSIPLSQVSKHNDSLYAAGEYANNLVIYNLYKDKKDTIEIGNDHSPAKRFSSVYSVKPLDSDGLLAATTHGLFYYNLSSGQRILYSFNDAGHSSEASNHLNSLFEDRDHTIWVGSNEGLFKINRSNNNFLNTNFQKNQFYNRYCNEIIKNTAGELVFCFDNVDSLYFVDTKSSNPKVQAYRVGQQMRDILHAQQVDEYTYLVSSWNGTFLFNRQTRRTTPSPFLPDTLLPSRATSFLIDNANNLWIGLGGGVGLFRYNLQTKSGKHFSRYKFEKNNANYLPMRNVVGMIELADGQIAFYNNQADSKLCIWSPADDRIHVVKAKNLYKNYEPYHGVTFGIAKDHNNNGLWLATLNGLIYYNVRDSIYKQYGRNEGITNSNVSALAVDRLNNLWIGTYRGLYHLNTKTNHIHHFENDIALRDAVIDYCYYDSTTDQVYLTSMTGFFNFNIRDLFVNNTVSRTYIDEIFVNQQKIDMNTRHEFKHTERNFQFNLGSVNLIDGATNQYYYKLLPIDTTWKRLGRQTQINFANLSPGEFTICATSRNSDDVWGSEIAYEFRILKPFYQTAWFIILMLLIIIGLCYGLFAYRLKQVKKIELIRNRLSRDLHDDIGSTLSSINILSRTAQRHAKHTDDEKITSSLEKINERSQRLLTNMSDIIWNINPDNDTTEELMSRIREYSTSMLEAKEIQYTIHFTSERQKKLSMEVKSNLYLIFKEAVNNLVKYSGCSHAALTLSFDTKKIYLKVEDNGYGFDMNDVKHRGGLSNMQHRAKEMKGELTITSVKDSGTRVELTVHVSS